MGIETGTWTLDFECQGCGVKVVLHPANRIAMERLFAWIMLPAIFPSLFFFASARRKARAWTDHPVVAAAVASRPLGPPDRACACGGAGRCTAIVLRRTRWMSLGRRYDYECRRCTTVFSVHDVAGVLFSLFAAATLAALGALIVVFPPGSAVHAEHSNQWFGVALLALAALAGATSAMRISARVAHPELP